MGEGGLYPNSQGRRRRTVVAAGVRGVARLVRAQPRMLTRAWGVIRLAGGAETARELPERLEDSEEDVEAKEPDQHEGRLELGGDEGARPDRERDEEHGADVELEVLER